MKHAPEHRFEKLLLASRWMLAPIYFGLALVVFALGIKFFQELYHLVSHVLDMKEADLVLMVLALIDLTLVASLIVMVMFSSYQNFVSRLELAGDEKLDWIGKLDAGALKIKVATSIVAISSIHLLRIFVKVEETPNDKILWYVVVHLTFVVSALLMAVLDRLAFASHRH